MALTGDVWAGGRNPAAIGQTIPLAGTCWIRQYELPELNREMLAASGSLAGNSAALNASTFGSELYRETEIELEAARDLTRHVTAGIAVGGMWLNIERYPSARAVTFSAGLLARPRPWLTAGLVWRNLNEPWLAPYRDRIPASLATGIVAEIAAQGRLAVDVVQEQYHRAEYRFGAEADFGAGLRVRVGARMEPFRPAAGFDFVIGRWRFIYGGDLHPDLGATHDIGLEFRLPR